MKKYSHLLLLFLILCVLAACSSKPTSQWTTSTPTPEITSVPTIPAVPGEEIFFTTQDNVHLSRQLYGESGTTARICSHMYPGSTRDWASAASWFARALTYDFRGFGPSQGKFEGQKLDRDLLAAIQRPYLARTVAFYRRECFQGESYHLCKTIE